MPEAWINLECPACGEDWEDDPADLPGSDQEFECPNCRDRRRTAEFMKTQRDLEMLEQFA